MGAENTEKISVDDARKISKLARLDLDQDKLTLFAGQFNDILNYMDQLGEVDTTGVEPLYSPCEHGTVFREDKAVRRFERSDVLANAPEATEEFFVVPKIV